MKETSEDQWPGSEGLRFTYPKWPTLFGILFGLFFAACGFYVMVNHNSIPMEVNGAAVSKSSPWWVGLLFFLPGLGVVTSLVWFAFGTLRESILVDAGTISWIGAKGRVLATSPFEDVIPGSYRFYGNREEIHTLHGPIRWWNQIKRYGRLRAIATELTLWSRPIPIPEIPIPVRFVCRYSPWRFIGLSVSALALLVAAFVLEFFPGIFQSGPDSAFGLRVVGLAELVIAIPFSLGAAYFIRRGSNERVEIEDGRIRWIGGNGRTVVDTPFQEVRPGTYDQDLSPFGVPKGFHFETSSGTVRWGLDITNLDELNMLAHQLAGRSKH